MLSDGGWLGTGQASVACLLCCDWLSERALPAYTSPPGCPRWIGGPRSWTCQLAPRSPSYEGSGAHCKAEGGGVITWIRFIYSRPAGPDLTPAEGFIWWQSSGKTNRRGADKRPRTQGHPHQERTFIKLLLHKHHRAKKMRHSTRYRSISSINVRKIIWFEQKYAY